MQSGQIQWCPFVGGDGDLALGTDVETHDVWNGSVHMWHAAISYPCSAQPPHAVHVWGVALKRGGAFWMSSMEMRERVYWSGVDCLSSALGVMFSRPPSEYRSRKCAPVVGVAGTYDSIVASIMVVADMRRDVVSLGS